VLSITILPFVDITVYEYFQRQKSIHIFVDTVIHFERIEPYKYGRYIGWYCCCYISCTHKINVTWYLHMLTMSFISHYMPNSDHVSHRCTKFKDITNVTKTKTKTRLSDWLLFIVSSIWSICMMWTIVHTSGRLLIFPIKAESECNYNLFRKGQQVQMRKMYHNSHISAYI
jgi:hypothetical protein